MVSIVSIVLLFIISTVSLVEGLATATNCVDASHAIQLKGFTLKPDPVKVPSIALFDLLVDLSQDMAHPIKVDITLETRVLFFWVKAPCTNGAGSCSYPAWCELCQSCNCPLKAGSHSMSMSMNITTAVPTGDYRATIEFTSATNQKGCVYIENILLN